MGIAILCHDHSKKHFTDEMDGGAQAFVYDIQQSQDGDQIRYHRQVRLHMQRDATVGCTSRIFLTMAVYIDMS